MINSRTTRKWVRFGKPVLLVLVYLVFFLPLSQVSIYLRSSPGTAAWYPPAGFSFALLVLFGPEYAPLVFITVLASSVGGYGLPINIPVILIALFSALGYALTAAFLRRRFGPRLDFANLREVTSFILAGVLVPLLLSAFTAALLSLSGIVSTMLYAPALFQLWVGDTLGNLALAPFLILSWRAVQTTWRIWPIELPSRQQVLAVLPQIGVALAQGLSVLAALWIVFGLRATDDRRIWYLFFLPLMWVILQFGLRGASVVILGTTIGSILSVHTFHYPLAEFEDLQIFMLMFALTGLITAAAFHELRRAQIRLRSRLDMEGRITSISTRFIHVSAESVDEEIQQALQSFGEFCGVDRCHLMLYQQDAGGLKIQRIYEWAAATAATPEPMLERHPLAMMPWIIAKLERGETVYLPNVNALPPEAVQDRAYFEGTHLRSLASVPLLLGNRLVGSLGFHSETSGKIWMEEDLRLLSLLSEIFLNVLERQRVETQVRESDRKFRSVVVQSYDGIVIVNEQSQVIEWNRGMERITGLSRSQTLGRPIWQVQYEMLPNEKRTPDALQKIRNVVERFHLEGKASFLNKLDEVDLERPDGTRRIMQSLIFPIPSSRGGYMAGTIARDVTELRQGQAALLRSQANLSEAERLARLGNFQIEIPGGQMMWSDEVYRICGWPIDRPVVDLKDILEYIHAEDRQRVVEVISRLIEEKTAVDVEYRILVHRETVRHIHTVGRPLLNKEGKVVSIFGTVMDITERKQAEEARRESDARYMELADSISDVFLGLDTHLRITYWNRASEKLTGISSDKALGKSLYDLIPNLRGTTIEQFALEAFRSQQQQGFIMEYRLNGRKNYLEVNAYPSHNGVSVFMRDVTERQAAEERVRQSEARYRAVVEDQTELICRFLPDATVTFVNEAYCRCFLSQRKELVGKRFITYLPGGSDRDLAGQYTSLRSNKPRTYEYQAVLPDGKLHWLQFTDRPIFSDDGIIVEYQTVGRDISESKRMEEELRYLSTHDALTGIYNRSFFETELARLQRSRQYPISILMVDVNGLKSTNDSRGHPAGDDLLRRSARVLEACFRPDDVVARFGGDEFAVLLPDTDEQAAEEVLNRVRTSLDVYNRGSRGAPLSLSIGIATGEKSSSLLEVLSRADERMYRDKVRQKGTGELKNLG